LTFELPLDSKENIMFSKSIMTLLAGSIALGASISTSAASDTGRTVRDHRTEVTVRDHRSQRPNHVVIVGQGKYECRAGFVQLYKMGYTNIRANDCRGAVYHYTARDGLMLFRARMSSHTGDLKVKMVGIMN
jgi:hypothetical protein